MRETYPECRVLEPEWKSAEPLAEARGARSIVYEYPDVVSGSGLTDHSAQAWADLKNTGQYDVIVSGFYYAQENPVVLTSKRTPWSHIHCTRQDRRKWLFKFLRQSVSYIGYEGKKSLHMSRLYPSGAGIHNPALYYNLYARLDEKFGKFYM